MKSPLQCLLLLFVLLQPLLADVYVPPEEHREWARKDLESKLQEYPPEKQVEVVQSMLAHIPQDRVDLQARVDKREAEAAAGDNSYPFPYVLRKGFTAIDYREEVMKDWLEEHGAKPIPYAQTTPANLSEEPAKPPKPVLVRPRPAEVRVQQPKVTPTTSSAPATPLVTPPVADISPPLSPEGLGLSNSQVVALLFLAAGVLFGIKRALK